MGFKMKNPGMGKIAREAGNNRVPTGVLYNRKGSVETENPLKKTYKEAYAGLSAEQKKKYKDEADFIGQAKAYNKKKYGTTEVTKKAKEFGVTKAEMAETVKPKNVTARKGGEQPGPKTTKVAEKRKPSKHDQMTTAKKEGGRAARKVKAAERKLAKAAGDDSRRGDRKRRKAAKKLEKAGIKA